MTFLEAILLAVVEGLTEYLPVSSTGHLIITSALLGIHQDPFTKDFTVIVQFGAILSVLLLYGRRFMTSWTFYLKLLIGFLPAAAIGLVVKNWIDLLLGSVTAVAVALILGGVVLIFVDRWFAHQEKHLNDTGQGSVDHLTYWQALGVGVVQCLAFIPGVSRSAASIIGGLALKLTRKAAAEFSFFLGVPTLAAATGYKLFKVSADIEPGQIPLLVVGNAVSFVVGAVAIKGFIEFLTRRGFFVFGVYRIALGLLLLALIASGQSLALI